MGLHESGYGGWVTTNRTYVWENTGGNFDVMSWRYREVEQMLDTTYCDGGVNMRRQWQAGLLDTVEAWVQVLVPNNWVTTGQGNAAGLRAGDAYTVNLYKNAASYISFAGTVMDTEFSSPLDGPNTCVLHMIGNGGAITVST